MGDVSLNHSRILSDLFAGIAILSLLVWQTTPVANSDMLRVVFLTVSLGYITKPVLIIAAEYEARKRRGIHESSD